MCSDINSSSSPIDDFYYKEFSSNPMGCAESQQKKTLSQICVFQIFRKKSDTETRYSKECVRFEDFALVTTIFSAI
jgi:hypothetical protein